METVIKQRETVWEPARISACTAALIVAERRMSEHACAVFELRGTRLIVTRTGIASGDAKGSVADEVRRVELLVDRASVEAFVNAGELSTSRCFLPTASGIGLRVDGGEVKVESLACGL